MGVARAVLYATAMIRVVGVIASALLLPWFFLVYHEPNGSQTTRTKTITGFKLGVENITPSFLKSVTPDQKNSYRVGLVTNRTGTDQTGTSTAAILAQHGLPLHKVITPDQDFALPQLKISGGKTMAVPIFRIGQEAIHTFFEKQLKDLDTVFFDMQDSGIRYYHTISLLFELIKIGALYDKTIVVLDRPNVLGSSIEGAVNISDTTDELSLPVPLRYGMTIGELARYLNMHMLHKSARLFVVPMEHYERTVKASQANPAQLASINTHIDVMQSSSILGILAEVHPFDMAQDTDDAYQCILLPECLHIPKQKWYELKAALKDQHIESNFYRYFNKKKHQYMTGLRLFTTSSDSMSSFSTLLTVLRFFKEHGVRMSFSDTFDKAVGTKKIRAYLEGKLAWSSLETDINKGLKQFFAKAQRAFLYKPYPKLLMM